MVTSAEEARRRAQHGAAAQRLVNETAVQPLTEASARGEVSVKLAFDAIALPPLPALRGRTGDLPLIELLEKNGHTLMGNALRKFSALGFRLSSYIELDMESDAESVVDKVRRARFDHLVLNYAAAQEMDGRGRVAILDGVTLQPAYHWRQRAESAGSVQKMESAALSMIDASAARGDLVCRIGWRDLSRAPLNAPQLAQLAEALRGRGFQTEPADAGTGLRVRW